VHTAAVGDMCGVPCTDEVGFRHGYLMTFKVGSVRVQAGVGWGERTNGTAVLRLPQT